MSLLVGYDNSDSDSSQEESTHVHGKVILTSEKKVEEIQSWHLSSQSEAHLPPVTSTPCPPELQKRIVEYIGYCQDGYDFMENLKSKRELKNPSLLHKIVTFFDIDPICSTFPLDVFHPPEYTFENWDYENLRNQQSIYMSNKAMRAEYGNTQDSKEVMDAMEPPASPPQKKQKKSRWH